MLIKRFLWRLMSCLWCAGITHSTACYLWSSEIILAHLDLLPGDLRPVSMPTDYSWIGESKEQNIYKRGSRGEFVFFSAVPRGFFIIVFFSPLKNQEDTITELNLAFLMATKNRLYWYSTVCISTRLLLLV